MARHCMPHMWTAPTSQGVLQCFDQIACVHMSGLLVRSHMNAGQDGFRDGGSKQKRDLVEGHCDIRSVPRRGSHFVHETVDIGKCIPWARRCLCGTDGSAYTVWPRCC
jgi:hypothetical protein